MNKIMDFSEFKNISDIDLLLEYSVKAEEYRTYDKLSFKQAIGIDAAYSTLFNYFKSKHLFLSKSGGKRMWRRMTPSEIEEYETKERIKENDTSKNNDDIMILKIPYGKRTESIQKKITLEKDTACLIDSFFENSDKLKSITNYEKSKITEAIIKSAFQYAYSKMLEGHISISEEVPQAKIYI